MKKNLTEHRKYRVNWNGHPQPLGSNSWHSVKMYINHSLSLGGCHLWEFEIFDQYGQLKTNLVKDAKADPTETKNYFRIF